MNDNRISRVDFNHARASELFASVCSDEKTSIKCDEHKHILCPVEGMEEIPRNLALRFIAAERVDLLLATINIQFELAAKGAERVKHIEANKQALVSSFPDQNIERALDLDIGQQSCDTAIMTTLSHTALMFAEKYGKGQDSRLETYRDKVFDMLALYEENNSYFKITSGNFTSNRDAMQNYRVSSQDLSLYVVKDPAEVYHHDTREICELNVMLAEMCEKQFENGIRSLHYWKEELGGLPKTEKTGIEIYDKYCAPKHEWEYEIDLQQIMSERVGILSTRAHKLNDLVDRTAPVVS